jgi:hypothetical protein
MEVAESGSGGTAALGCARRKTSNMEITFPIFVRLKDSGEVRKYASLLAMLEKIRFEK